MQFFVAIVVIVFAIKPIPDWNFFSRRNKSVKYISTKLVILLSTKINESGTCSSLLQIGLYSGHSLCLKKYLLNATMLLKDVIKSCWSADNAEVSKL